ncbi:hypothetical protein IN07_23110 [Modestobacter caceresii]|uniref:DUF1772 domain-containing protein n=1 Tax=Modestobacter caceresii TaxID=1522368 RepID=A0A098Y271_9ACTN|nr:DUF1772 domain-containing protein [Modestobacter caceresii]KGH44544.1 hypothetical protein IN07_23110 [Modestobacter caceresii]
MLLVAHLIAVSAYAGFQWTVRVLVYPQFDRVPAADFPGYERAHQRRVSRVVGPLFAAEVVTSGWLVVDRPDGTPLGLALAAAALVALVLLVTAVGAVPLHRRQDAGWDAAVHRRLLRVDSLRVGLATAAVGVAALLVG